LKLESMQLENIRSHVKTAVHFGDGFNCLVGGLGQGKSTILYALDFVLFGDPLGRSYDYLLREGAEEGKVTIVFDQNGRIYKLQRALYRRGNGISQDIDQLKFYRDGRLVAGTKNDAVAEELMALTGLDKNLFREIVWVRQEHLKELLDITPRHRQKKLDQLFELSNYEVAWSGLHQFERDYNTEKKILERDADVIRIGKLEDNYTKAVEEFSSITIQLQDAKRKLAQAESILKEATANLEGLEELRKETEGLQRKEIQLKTNITNIDRRGRELDEQSEMSKRHLEKFEEQMEKMKIKEKSHRDILQESGLKADKTMEELRDYLVDMEEQLRVIGGEQEATKREMKASQNRISSLLTESKCPTCLQNLTGDYKQSLLKKLQKEKTDNTKKLVKLQKSFDNLKSLHSVVDLAFSNLQQLLPRIENIKSQITEKKETLGQLSTEVEDALKQKKELQRQLDEIREEIAKFDVTELESARKLQKNAFTNYLTAEYEMEGMEQRKGDLASRVDELKERLENAQNKIERKEKIEKLLEILERIRGAYRSIQPKLRSEFVKYLQITVQQVLDSLVGDVGPMLNLKIDETYSPFICSEEGYEREVSNLSGGERTLLAFAYRIGLGQLIMQSRTGHGLFILLLDEPTESLGREDGSVDRLAEAVRRLKAIEQIIAVTHNEAFAEKAEHVIRIEKEAGESQVFMEK
jgi:exonuclease SbcC